MNDQETKWRLFGVWMLAGLAMSVSARICRASETNYQPYVVGERALAMGGAYTAAVNDAMAGFYNPGGLAFAETSMISASQRLYGRYRLKLENAFYPQSPLAREDGSRDAVDLGSTYPFVLPSTLALMTQFGKRIYRRGPKRHAIGFSILVPTQSSYTLRAKWKSPNAVPDEETYSLSMNERSVWTGITYALRANEKLGLGLSAFVTETTTSRRLDRSWIVHSSDSDACPATTCGSLSFTESLLSTSAVTLLFRLGSLWAPHEQIRLGLMVSMPTALIPDLWLMKTQGRLDQTYGVSTVDGASTDRLVFYTDDYKLDVARYEPLAFRLGLAYLRGENLTLDLDGSLHLPISYDFIRGDPVSKRAIAEETASPSWFDASIVRRTQRTWTFNGNAGVEWHATSMWSLRGGIYSDFSSAPKVSWSTRPSLSHINRVGGVLSVGFRQEGYNITLGVVGVLGAGDVSVYRPMEAQSSSGRAWGPADYRERGIYIFIAGIQRAVARKAKEIISELEEAQQERDREQKRESDREARKARRRQQRSKTPGARP